MSASGAPQLLRAAMLLPRLTSLLTSFCVTDIGTLYDDYTLLFVVYPPLINVYIPFTDVYTPLNKVSPPLTSLTIEWFVPVILSLSWPEGASLLRTGGCGTDDGASTGGSGPCARCAPFRCLCVVRWTPSSSASSGAPLCGLWALPTGQEDVEASGRPAVGQQRDGSGVSPPSRRPCPAGAVPARRFGEFPAAVQAPSSLAPLGLAAVTPPGTLLGVEEIESPLASVGCPIPGSLGSYEVAEPLPSSPDHLSPGLSAWLGALESQPSRAPPEPESHEADPASVGAQPCARSPAMRSFRDLVADLGFERAAMVAFPDAAGSALPLPWGFQELATELPEKC